MSKKLYERSVSETLKRSRDPAAPRDECGRRKWVYSHYRRSAEEAAKLQKKLAKNEFDFNDFLNQIQQIKKMGNVKELMGMIPGMGKAIRDLDIDDTAFKGVEAIILSMTPEERANPDIINGSRKKRIALGSGNDIQEVNRLIKQFFDTRKMMKMVNSGKAKNLMQALSTRGHR